MTHSLPRGVRVLGMAAALGASERTGGAEGRETSVWREACVALEPQSMLTEPVTVREPRGGGSLLFPLSAS